MDKYSTLTREELLAISQELQKEVDELKAEIEKMRTPPPNDWHSWMDALLHIMLQKYYPDVDIQREFVLGVQPQRADFIVLRKKLIDLKFMIFAIFRKYNIVEFKSPSDELSIEVLWKAVGYTGSYIYFMKDKEAVSDDEVTLTLIRAAKPVKLFRELDGNVEQVEHGIYYIKNWKVNFPIQIIVTKELQGDEYAGIRAITKDPKEADVKKIFEDSKAETDPDMRKYYRAYWEISNKLTGDVLEEVKRRNPEMARTLMDLVRPEIDEEINYAVNLNTRNNLFTYVQKGGMSADFAAKEAGMNTVDFIASMREAGYTVPETA